jgi:porin
MLLDLLTAATIVAGNPEVLVVPADALPSKNATRSHSHTHSRDEIDENQSPVMLEVTYTAEAVANVSGGMKRRTRYLDNLDVVLEADMERLFGWGGAELHLYGLYNNGQSITQLVGDALAVSNIEDTGKPRLRLYEAWLSQQLSPSLSVKFGLYDVNSEFDTLESAGLFIGSSHEIGMDISQSPLGGPSEFPETSLAIRLEKSFQGGARLRAAMINGAPPETEGAVPSITIPRSEGVYGIAELELPVKGAKLLVGHWRYSSKFSSFSGGRATGNTGYYLRGEAELGELGQTQIDGFFRLGTASGRFNMFDRFASAGIKFIGLLDQSDEAGLAISTARTSKGYRLEQSAEQSETAIELTYRKNVHPNMTLQPTIQYVLNPSADPLVEDALVVGVRSEFAFRF